MTSIRISASASSATTLMRAARRADTNRDGYLTSREIKNAAGVNGAPATAALKAEHAVHRASIWRDIEIPQSQKPREAAFMDIVEVKYATDAAVEQLKKIDAYQGTRRPARPANKKDGVVTDFEVSNYHHTRGKLHLEAERLVRFQRALGQ